MSFKFVLTFLLSVVAVLVVLNIKKSFRVNRYILKLQGFLGSGKAASSLSLEGTSNLIMTYHVGNIVGFCSNMNNAMNALMLTKETSSTFLMIVYTGWNYVTLTEFISSPYVIEGKLDPYLKLQNSSVPIPKSWKKFPDFVAKLDHKLNLPIGPFENALWVPFRDLTTSLAKELDGGAKAVFLRKRKIVQEEFWHLQPKYENFISFLMQKHPLLRYPDDHCFIAMHVRRGDKITWGEMSEIAMTAYTDELEILARTREKIKKVGKTFTLYW